MDEPSGTADGDSTAGDGDTTAETAIHGGTVLTMRGDRPGIVDDGAVAFADGRITFVGDRAVCLPLDGPSTRRTRSSCPDR